MKPVRALDLLTLALVALPGAVSAQLAYAARDVNLRAGPGRDYPLVVTLPAGAELVVQGCLEDYRWCDVIAGPYRGWLYAGNISYPYQGAYVPVINYGAVIGIVVIGFVIGDYWRDHYHDRPWYSQRHRWEGRPVMPPPGARPPGPAYRYPPPPSGYPPPPSGYPPPPSGYPHSGRQPQLPGPGAGPAPVPGPAPGRVAPMPPPPRPPRVAPEPRHAPAPMPQPRAPAGSPSGRSSQGHGGQGGGAVGGAGAGPGPGR